MAWARRLLGLLTVLGASAPAWGTPNGWSAVTVWQAIKDPGVSARAHLLEMADRKREPRDETYDAPAIRTQLYRQAATLLGLADVTRLDDADLLFLYGECLTYAGDEYTERARDVLRQALSLAPGHPSAGSAWDSLGRVNMALNEFAEGYRAFEKALETEWDKDLRTSILIEQGQGALHAGRLELAIERLRGAQRDSDNPAEWAFAQWALAVAMDRALLGPQASRLAWEASRARFGSLGKQDVLSLPDVVLETAELLYYRALAAMGKARDVGPNERREAYQEAKFLWLRYLDAVGPNGKWVGRATRHMAAIDRAESAWESKEVDLDQQALEGPNFDDPDAAGGDAGPIWPEELELGQQFWASDSGAPP